MRGQTATAKKKKPCNQSGQKPKLPLYRQADADRVRLLSFLADSGEHLARTAVRIFGGLLVLALTAALVAPYFIDWTGYRTDFEREASAILGRSVTVEGEATARLLPFPSVTFSDVAVGGGPDGEPAMTVEEFSMDAELAPFMRGEFLIFDMRLVRPKMTVAVDADGTVDWAMRPSIAVRSGADRDREADHHRRPGADPPRGQRPRPSALPKSTREVSAKSLDGPWRVDGSLRLDGMRTAIGAVDRQGRREWRACGCGSRPTRRSIRSPIESRRRPALERGAAKYAGTSAWRRATTTGADAARRGGRADAGQGRAAGLARQRQASRSTTSGSPSTNSASRPARSTIPTRPTARPLSSSEADPRFAVRATARRCASTRRWRRQGRGRPDAAGAASRPCGRRCSTCRSRRSPGSIDVDLPAVVAGDTTIRDVKLQAEPAADGWKVKALAASLPGRTTLEGSRRAARPESDFGFTGSLLLAVGQPSGFAAWVSKDVDEAIRRLPAAGFKRQGRPDHRAPGVQRPRTHARQCEVPRRDRERRAERRQPVDARGARPATRSTSRAGGVRLAVRQRRRREPVRRPRPRHRGEGRAGQRRRPDGGDGRYRAAGSTAAIWRSTGWRSAGSPARRSAPPARSRISRQAVWQCRRVDRRGRPGAGDRRLAAQYRTICWSPSSTSARDRPIAACSRMPRSTSSATAARNDDGATGFALSANGNAGGTSFGRRCRAMAGRTRSSKAPMKLDPSGRQRRRERTARALRPAGRCRSA